MQAIRISGTKLFGVPIMIQPTMSEKNRLVHIRLNWFLIRCYGTPNGTGRCLVFQCYDKI